MSNDVFRRIGVVVCRNLADHFENIVIPSLWVCMHELERIKVQLENLKGGDNAVGSGKEI